MNTLQLDTLRVALAPLDDPRLDLKIRWHDNGASQTCSITFPDGASFRIEPDGAQLDRWFAVGGPSLGGCPVRLSPPCVDPIDAVREAVAGAAQLRRRLHSNADEALQALNAIKFPNIDNRPREAVRAACHELVSRAPTLAAAVDLWTDGPQLDMVIEECGELVAAIQRMRRKRTSADFVAEECADVLIMCAQLVVMIDALAMTDASETVLTHLRAKLDRLELRVFEANGCRNER